MSRDPDQRISPKASGGFELRLPAEERALLVSLPRQLLTELESLEEHAGSVPPPLRRLFPPAYLHDDRSESNYVEFVRDNLANDHRDGLELLIATAERDHLDDGELERWLVALNGLRLVLGTVLEVTEEPTILDPSDPHYGEWVCYTYLSFLEGEVVEALTSALPEVNEEQGTYLPSDPWGEPPGGLRWDGTVRPSDS